LEPPLPHGTRQEKNKGKEVRFSLLKVGKCSYDISISKRGNEKKAG
jgi:hypothetical protein